MTEKIEKYICDKLGGNIELREFEHKHNPMIIKADIYRLDLMKNYADYISRFYEQHIYKPIIKEVLKNTKY